MPLSHRNKRVLSVSEWGEKKVHRGGCAFIRVPWGGGGIQSSVRPGWERVAKGLWHGRDSNQRRIQEVNLVQGCQGGMTGCNRVWADWENVGPTPSKLTG